MLTAKPPSSKGENGIKRKQTGGLSLTVCFCYVAIYAAIKRSRQAIALAQVMDWNTLRSIVFQLVARLIGNE